jgi:hypothetical protein
MTRRFKSLAIFAGERDDSGQYAMTRIFRIRDSFVLGVNYICVLDVQFGCAFHGRMRFQCHF